MTSANSIKNLLEFSSPLVKTLKIADWHLNKLGFNGALRRAEAKNVVGTRCLEKIRAEFGAVSYFYQCTYGVCCM